jgi:hypothetical protein
LSTRALRVLLLLLAASVLALQALSTTPAEILHHLAERVHLQIDPLQVQVLSSRSSPAAPLPTGWFTAGQEASIVLSSQGFDRAGGPLDFLFPGNLTSDGHNLVLADTRNHRVLIWNRAPRGNDPPDLVLGQKDFFGNAPGTDLDRMNWPVGVATDGTRLVVADCWNDRLLVWSRFPTANGAPADFQIRAARGSESLVRMPYSAWTDGQVLAVANRGSGALLVWHGFPQEDRAPDVVFSGSGDLGGPRYLASDGRRLVVASYDSFRHSPDHATFFWSSVPRSDSEKYDFFMQKPSWFAGLPNHRSALLRGAFGPQGRFLALSEEGLLYGWSALPSHPEEAPDLFAGLDGLKFQAGDTSGLVYVGETLYLSLMNGNRILGFQDLEAVRRQEADFVIGSKSPDTSPRDERFILVNPNPVSDGRHLFVTSDFDQKMFVYRTLPGQTAARPDVVYRFPEGPWDTDLRDGRLVAAGGDGLWLWRRPPLNGELPDRVYRGRIGTVRFRDAKGVALDRQGRLYLADEQAGRIWVFASSEPGFFEAPVATLEVRHPRRLSVSDEHLAVVVQSGYELGNLPRVQVFGLQDLKTQGPTMGIRTLTNKAREHVLQNPQDVCLAGQRIFLANTFGHNVMIWNDLQQALAGQPADLILGQEEPMASPLASRNRLVMPGALAFDGSYLWVGEFKFSQRLLRFDVQPEPQVRLSGGS